jgi:hypothetical protein
MVVERRVSSEAIKETSEPVVLCSQRSRTDHRSLESLTARTAMLTAVEVGVSSAILGRSMNKKNEHGSCDVLGNEIKSRTEAPT